MMRWALLAIFVATGIFLAWWMVDSFGWWIGITIWAVTVALVWWLITEVDQA